MTPFRTLQQKFALIWPHLHERARRMMAANEALQLGYGGVSMVMKTKGSGVFSESSTKASVVSLK